MKVASGSCVARYYDPRTSVWQSADPILGEYLDGKHNDGIYNSLNLSMFAYAHQKPVIFTDPDGNTAYQMTNYVKRGSNHTFLVLMPNNFDDFKGTKYEKSFVDLKFTVNLPETGGADIELSGKAVVLRAGPADDDVFGGLLEAQTNYRDDPNNVTSQNTIYPRDPSMSDTDFIKSFLDKHENYIKNQNSSSVPEYGLPSIGEMWSGPEKKKDMEGYNSNSYINGLINSAGGQPINPDVKTPLYNNPVPENNYN